MKLLSIEKRCLVAIFCMGIYYNVMYCMGIYCTVPCKLGQLCQKNLFNTIYSNTSAIIYNISSDYFYQQMPLKLVISKKVVPDFWHMKNIHSDREIFSPT